MASKYLYEPQYGIPQSVGDISEDHLAYLEDTIINLIHVQVGGRFSLVAKMSV